MTPIELNIILFIAAILTFAAFGFSAFRKQHSAKDYFHDESLTKNVVSLTATNITLGTGLVYLVTGAQHNGILMLVTPLMVWLGYYLMAKFLDNVTTVSIRTGKNFLAGINDLISQETNKKSPFAKAVSASLVIMYILILAFEIFASAKVLAPFLFKNPSVSSEIWLSLIVFCITILYTILGGITAVFKVDILQVPLICLMVPAFIATAIPDFEEPSFLIERLGTSVKFNGAIIAGAALAAINAISTQFYSLLNWGAVSHVKLANQQRLLKLVGISTAVILALFVFIGLIHPVQSGEQVWQSLTNTYINLASQTSLKAYLLCGVLLLGMSSILLTSTDAVVITSIMFWYDNVSGGDSKNIERNPVELRKIRIIGTVAFILCFSVLITINYWQPDPFYLLLSMANGIAVFAPMIVVAGWLSSKKEGLKVFTARVVYTFLSLFILSGVISAIMLIRKSAYVGYVGISSFTLSLIMSFVLAFFGVRFHRKNNSSVLSS